VTEHLPIAEYGLMRYHVLWGVKSSTTQQKGEDMQQKIKKQDLLKYAIEAALKITELKKQMVNLHEDNVTLNAMVLSHTVAAGVITRIRDEVKVLKAEMIVLQTNVKSLNNVVAAQNKFIDEGRSDIKLMEETIHTHFCTIEELRAKEKTAALAKRPYKKTGDFKGKYNKQKAKAAEIKAKKAGL
jgi:hypothetical protein